MGTKANPGKYDCHAKAEPDEPTFTLLGRDKHAPTLIWLWAVLRELDGEKPEKIEEARDCCQAMIEYAGNKGIKISGLSESILAGLLELIRAVNWGIKKAGIAAKPCNEPLTIDEMRALMLRIRMEEAA